MNSSIPYEQIQNETLRTYTPQLLARLIEVADVDEELNDVCYALCQASDPRSIEPLTRLLFDQQQPEAIRRGASRVLRHMDAKAEDPEAKLEEWWSGCDQVLQRHALLQMGVYGRETVLDVARDRQHPLHAEALGAMQNPFSHPSELQLLIDGLSHPKSEVREAAASTLLWEEPVAAETPLLAATCDVPNVATEACAALAYYQSQRVLWRMAELREDSDEDVAGQAQWSFKELRDDFSAAARNEATGGMLRKWMRPVLDLLDLTEPPVTATFPPPLTAPASDDNFVHHVRLRDMQNLLENGDLPAREAEAFLYGREWSTAIPAERPQIHRLLLEAPDAAMHHHAAKALAAWGDQNRLRDLLDHPEFGVRKAAMYHLGETPPFRPAIADNLWERFQGVKHLGMHGTETLGAWVAHAVPQVAVPRLMEMVLDRRELETVRVNALWKLGAHLNREMASRLVPLLAEPPAVTWSLHGAILDSIREFNLPLLDVAPLREVDNLYLQIALANYDCRDTAAKRRSTV